MKQAIVILLLVNLVSIQVNAQVTYSDTEEFKTIHDAKERKSFTKMWTKATKSLSVPPNIQFIGESNTVMYFTIQDGSGYASSMSSLNTGFYSYSLHPKVIDNVFAFDKKTLKLKYTYKTKIRINGAGSYNLSYYIDKEKDDFYFFYREIITKKGEKGARLKIMCRINDGVGIELKELEHKAERLTIYPIAPDIITAEKGNLFVIMDTPDGKNITSYQYSKELKLITKDDYSLPVEPQKQKGFVPIFATQPITGEVFIDASGKHTYFVEQVVSEKEDKVTLEILKQTSGKSEVEKFSIDYQDLGLYFQPKQPFISLSQRKVSDYIPKARFILKDNYLHFFAAGPLKEMPEDGKYHRIWTKVVYNN